MRCTRKRMTKGEDVKFYGVLKDYPYEGNSYLGFFRKRENAEKFFKDNDLGEFDDIIELTFGDSLTEDNREERR